MKLHVGSVRRRNVNMQVSVDSLASGNTVSRANSPTTAVSASPNRSGTFVEYGQNVPRYNAGALLIEEARINGLRNPRGEGASTQTLAAGTGTGTAVATNWSFVNRGSNLSADISAITAFGATGLRIRLYGTTSGAPGAESLEFESRTGVAASAGQIWTGSFYYRLVSGTIPAGMFFSSRMLTFNAVPAVVDNVSGIAQTLDTTLRRVNQILTAGAAVVNVVNDLHLTTFPASTVCDFTIDVFYPQLEQGLGVSSVTLPIAGTPTASIRGWDITSRSIAPTAYSSRNLLLSSEDFNNATWAKTACTITSGAIAGPYTGTLGDALIGSAVATAHNVNQTRPFTPSIGTRYTLSVYAKAGAQNFLRMSLPANAGGGTVGYFDLTTGAYTASSGAPGTAAMNIVTTAKAITAGWWRCSFTYTITNSSNVDLNFGAALNVLSGTYTGDGVTVDMYLWGAQYAESATVPAYIKTIGAQAASHSKGTLVVVGKFTGALATASFPTMASIYDDTNNHMTWIYNPFIPSMELVGPVRGVALVDSQFGFTSLPVLNQTYRLALSWDTSTGVLSAQAHNGTTLSAVYTVTLDLMPVFNSLGIGTDSGGNVVLLQELSRVALYNIVVPAASLSQLIAA